MRRPLKRAAYDSGIPPGLPAAPGGGRHSLSGSRFRETPHAEGT